MQKKKKSIFLFLDPLRWQIGLGKLQYGLMQDYYRRQCNNSSTSYVSDNQIFFFPVDFLFSIQMWLHSVQPKSKATKN